MSLCLARSVGWHCQYMGCVHACFTLSGNRIANYYGLMSQIELEKSVVSIWLIYLQLSTHAARKRTFEGKRNGEEKKEND